MTLATVSKVGSPREATIYLTEAKRAEDLLRQLGELDDRLRELITYELSVYRAIADAGICGKVKGVARRYACEKFAELSEAQIGEVVTECVRRGMTLRGYFEALRARGREQVNIDRIAQAERNAIDTYSRDGRAKLVNFVGGRSDSFSDRIADAVRDRTKDRLLSMGAVGIGDGVYVDPDKYPNDVWKALVIRLKSIGDDVRAALSIASKLPSAPDEDQLAYMDELSFRGFSRLLLIERGSYE